MTEIQYVKLGFAIFFILVILGFFIVKFLRGDYSFDEEIIKQYDEKRYVGGVWCYYTVTHYKRVYYNNRIKMRYEEMLYKTDLE